MKKHRAHNLKAGKGDNPKPHAGNLIHRLALEKGFTMKKLASVLDMSEGNVYKIVKKPYALIEHAIILSIAFNEDLVQQLFAPGLSPRPNPLQGEVDRLNNIVQQLQQQAALTTQQHDEIMLLKGRIEELEKLLREERERR